MKTVSIMTVTLSMEIAEPRMVKDPRSNLIWDEKVTPVASKVYCETLRPMRCMSEIK